MGVSSVQEQQQRHHEQMSRLLYAQTLGGFSRSAVPHMVRLQHLGQLHVKEEREQSQQTSTTRGNKRSRTERKDKLFGT
jgi:hypothetical protein